MSTEYIELLLLAEKLLEPRSEVALRASASRAYYYAYHSVKDHSNYLESFVFIWNSGSHKSLIYSLEQASRTPNNSDARITGKLAVSLKQALLIRTKADYKLKNNFGILDAKYVIKLARDVEELIAEDTPKD